MRAANYDLIVDIDGNLRSRSIATAGGRVVRYHKRTLRRKTLVHLKWNLYSARNGAASVAVRYLSPLRRLGVTDDGLGLEVFLDDHDRTVAAAALREADIDGVSPLIGIAPSARHRNKMWPAERFAQAAAMILKRRGGAIVLLGAEHDRMTCQAVQEELSKCAPKLQTSNLAGTMSLTQTAAVMDHCAVILANDSGLMHLAAARKRPLVALFGPTVPRVRVLSPGHAERCDRTASTLLPALHHDRPPGLSPEALPLHAGYRTETVAESAERVLSA